MSPRLISDDRGVARSCTGGEAPGKGEYWKHTPPLARARGESERRHILYFIGEKAAGIRILFCWLTKNSRVFGGQLGSFCDSSRIRARSAKSL
jgi:hypothetical protein